MELEVDGLRGFGLAMGKSLARIGNKIAYNYTEHELVPVTAGIRNAVETTLYQEQRARSLIGRETEPDLWTLPPDSPRSLAQIRQLPDDADAIRAVRGVAIQGTDLHGRDLALFGGDLSKAPLYNEKGRLQVMAYPLAKEDFLPLREMANRLTTGYSTIIRDGDAGGGSIRFNTYVKSPWEYDRHDKVIYLHAQADTESERFYAKADVPPFDLTDPHPDPGGTTTAFEPEQFAAALAHEPALRAEFRREGIAGEAKAPVVVLGGDIGRPDSAIASRFVEALRGHEGFDRDFYIPTSSQVCWFRGQPGLSSLSIEFPGQGPLLSPSGQNAAWAHYPPPGSPHWNGDQPRWRDAHN